MSTINTELFQKQFISVYEELYALHPTRKDGKQFQYLSKEWFFSNHINIVLDNIITITHRYYPNSDEYISLFGGLLHDAGLVYQRTEASAKGHESRSVAYARNVLAAQELSSDYIDRVCECIDATEPEYVPCSDEAIVVRNADAYAHLTSLHFFAKANFTEQIEDFISWFENKLESTFLKLTIPELISEMKPIYLHYKKAVQIYKQGQEMNHPITHIKYTLENA